MNTGVENVTIAHDKLNAAVKAVAAVIPKRSQKPTLRNLRVRSTAGNSWMASGVEVYATDLETAAIVSLGDTDGDTVETALIPAETAAAIGKAKEPAAIVVGNEVIEALGGRVPVADVMEYPAPPETFDSGFEAWIPFEFVRGMDDAVACATDNESSRYALGGILVERVVGKGFVRAIGTDGRRLHALTVDDGGTDKHGLSVIVYPHAIRLFRKAVQTMAAAIAGKGGKAAAGFCDAASVGVRTKQYPSGSTEVEFSWAVPGCVVRVVTRSVEGRFPRWMDCFPAESFEASAVTIPVPAGREQIVAAARYRSEQNKGVQFSGGTLSSRSAEHGEYSAPFVGTMDDGVRVKLDPDFLLDMIDGAVAVSSRDTVRLYVRDHQSATTMKVNGGIEPTDGIGFAAVLMPLAAD